MFYLIGNIVGMRIKGFDLMHFMVVIEMNLKNKNFDEAFSFGLREIKKYDPYFFIDKQLFWEEFKRVRVKI